MKRIPPIRQFMTPFPWHIQHDAPLLEARALMEKQGIHHLPVLQGDQVVGLLSAPLHGVDQVADAMGPVVCVEDSERADQVLEKMVMDHLRAVLVLHHQRIAGVFTWRDACHHFARQLREPFLPPKGDGAA